jgi:predicted RNase H-like HicB family nuclease
MTTFPFTAIIEREGDKFVALCPELDVASQGADIAEARYNLREAVELFLEVASEEEVRERLHDEVYVSRMEATIA